MMFGSEIDTLLQKSLQPHPQMVCNRTLKHDIDDLIAAALPGRKLAVIDDRNTAVALGDQVFRALQSRGNTIHVTLPGTPVPDDRTTAYIREATLGCDGLVAVGSGTINDLCKYAAFQDKKPYVVFPTAASMNGYCSANASITIEGYKKTLPAAMPLAVFCDLSVIAAAPVVLSKSGLGDSLARGTAQADWLLSHLLLGTPYNETPFALLAPLEPQLLEHGRGIAKADSASIELLVKTLLLSGLGMTIAGGSYPASQAEHMIAHAMSMVLGPWPLVLGKNNSKHQALSTKNHFHGEEIGVTTLAMAKLQENVLKKRPALRPTDFPKEAIEKLFGHHAATEAAKTYATKQKNISEKKLDPRLRGNDGGWESIAAQIEKIMITSTKIQSVLTAAEAPDRPEMLGWDNESYNAVLSHARFLRDRFTFLDLQ